MPVGEAAIESAALQLRMATSREHWRKADTADELHKKRGLPDIGKLLRDLNDARKAAAYGDVPAPALDAEDVASNIKEHVDAVARLVEGPP
ncbi:MAG: hypothetical protein ACRD3O_15500 [Terriglobia bacterium]